MKGPPKLTCPICGRGFRDIPDTYCPPDIPGMPGGYAKGSTAEDELKGHMQRSHPEREEKP